MAERPTAEIVAVLDRHLRPVLDVTDAQLAEFCHRIAADLTRVIPPGGTDRG